MIKPASELSTELLLSYDDMMFECTIKVEKFSPLAVAVWSAVLRELDARGKVKLISGSYDDIGNALIQRVK
jgi:hypothetical protein